MTPQTLPDIVGPQTTALVATAGTRRARHVCFTCTGTGPVRWGDANVSATRGQAIPSGVSVITPANEGDIVDSLDLAAINVYVPSGTTLTVTILV